MAETQVEAEQQKDESIEGKLGFLLKSYREKNGHDVYEVAEALCLSPTIVKSLEEENFDALPEPPYIRGYLRSYAKFAGIDSQEIIDLYEQQRGADPQDLEYHFKPNDSGLNKPAISATTLRLGLIGTLLIALAGISMIPAVNSWISDTWDGFSKQTAEKNYAGKLAENQIEIPAPLPGDEAEKQVKDSSSTTATKSVDTKEESTDLADKTAEKTDQKNKADSDPESNANPAVEDADKKNATENEEGTKLRFVFKTDVWMRIKDKDKKVVFEGLSPAGTEKELRLQIPITFRIGNAKGIEIYIEGKYFDITNRIKGSVATFKIN